MTLRVRWQARITGGLAVLGGGLAGSAARVLVFELAQPTAGGWPFATLGVNLAGAFLVGAFLARRERVVSRPWSIELVAIGLLGSFTTFSALSLETFLLLDLGRTGVAGQYVAVSTIGGAALAFLGDAAGRRGT